MCDEEFGESSNNNENNNDAGRPFKKAKYVWQVKGKYHLKPTNQQQQSLQETNNCNDNDITMRDENDDEICTNSTCVDRLLARTEAILDAMTSDDEDLQSTISTTTNRNIERSISNEIPITLVTPNQQYNQDYYLNKWQARQMARSYIDNTINSVLETWVTAPFDAEDFVDNCDEDGHVEDEGILMAIKSHGLQSTKTLNKTDNNNSSNNNNSNNNSSLAFLRPDELAENALEKFDSIESEVIKHSLESKLVPDESTIIDNNISGNNNNNHNGQTYRNNDENCMDINNYPVDILNAAILVAIERKGLSSA